MAVKCGTVDADSKRRAKGAATWTPRGAQAMPRKTAPTVRTAPTVPNCRTCFQQIQMRELRHHRPLQRALPAIPAWTRKSRGRYDGSGNYDQPYLPDLNQKRRAKCARLLPKRNYFIKITGNCRISLPTPLRFDIIIIWIGKLRNGNPNPNNSLVAGKVVTQWRNTTR